MNKLFNNMSPYEVVLLVMGVVIFLVLIFLMIWNVMKQRTITSFLPFFLLPVIMVGHPSIKSIKIVNGIIGVEKLTETVNQDPSDTTASKNLEEAVAQLKSGNRLLKNEKGLITVANAQISLGKYDSASLYLNKAGKLAAESDEVKTLKRELDNKIMIREEFSRNIINLNDRILQLRQTSGDTQSFNSIVRTLSSISIPTYTNPNEILTLAKAYAITGNKQESLKAINKLNKATPTSDIKLIKLKDSINSGFYQKQFFKYNEQPKVINLPYSSKKNLNQTVIKKNKYISKPLNL